MLVATDAKGDYAFLNLKGPAFDLSDRGVVGPRRAGGARRLRLHRARRLSLRRDRAHHGAAARRAGRGRAERAADARGRAAGRPRISPRRGARSGRRRPFARACRSTRRPRPAPGACAPSPIRSVPRSARRRFLVEDYVPDRLEFDLAAPAGSISAAAPAKVTRRRPLSLRRAGLRPRSRRRGGDRRRPRSGRVSPAISSAWPTRRSTTDPPAAGGPAADRRQGQGELRRHARQGAGDDAAAGSAGDRAAGRSRRPRGRAQAHAAGRRRPAT